MLKCLQFLMAMIQFVLHFCSSESGISWWFWAFKDSLKVHGLKGKKARDSQGENNALICKGLFEACASYEIHNTKKFTNKLYLPVRTALCSVPFLNLTQTKWNLQT